MKIVFAENLKNLRQLAKLSQSQLAEKLNATQRKVSYWESGSVEPSLSDLWTIADFFDVSIDYLMGRTGF